MKQTKYLFLSIKPEFANKIIAKEKTIELRKVRPHVNQGDYVVIYASSPTMSVVGFGQIKQIIEMSPDDMWNTYSSKLGIDRTRFDIYFQDKDKAVGIEFESIKKVQPVITLDKIREVDQAFCPPQSYRYVSNIQIINLLHRIIVGK